MKPTILLLTIAALLSGCATSVTSPEQVTRNTRSTFDAYTQTETIDGMVVDQGGFPNITRAKLVATRDSAGTQYFLHVHHWSQTGWKFLENAADINGNRLEAFRLDTDVTYTGNVEETLSIPLTLEYLQERTLDGLNVKLWGQRGEVVVELPSPYVVGFLEKVGI
ncbi:MAG: hypothetical protein ABQ298_03705 [Puniceicoccaceae bacterium]